ncbi:MAG: TonB-dependent receptor [Deltaproteobacteria bacterium]|nr:TonB-dependent receptor [Deltaproteobacteria bacterium]
MAKKYYIFTTYGLLFILFQGFSFAQTITLEEIVVRGTRQINPEEVLDIRDVRETPARDVGEALKTIEGVNLIRKGVIANDVIIRGFQRDNTNVLIDGMRLYGACPNRMDACPFHVDFAEIEEVTVLKGPFDVKNAGSLGGMINIKTLSPQKGATAGINALVGSYENINGSFNASYGGEKADALFGYSYKYSLPYKDGDGDRITEQYPATSPNRYREGEEDDKAYAINTYWTKLGFNPADNQRMELSYSRQEANDVIYPYLLMDAVYDDTDRVNWTYEASNVLRGVEKLSAQFYWNQVRHKMTDWRRVSSVGWATGYMMKTFAETRTFGGNVGLEFNVYEGVLAAGVDYYLRNWEADTTLPTGIQDSIPDVDVRDVGTYAEYARSVTEEVRLILGARFDHVKTEANENRGDFYALYHGTRDREETDSYGSGNIQVSYTPVERVELFAGFGLSVRPPDPVERYFALARPMTKPNWVGNPDLDPAKNREFDIGIKYLGDLFYGKATFFYSDVKDFITIYNAPALSGGKNARSYRNVDATLYGGELSLNLDLPKNFTLNGGLSYTWGRDDSFDKPLFEIPPLEGRMALRYAMEKYFAEIEGIWTDDQGRVDDELNEEKTAGWGIMNLKVGVTYKKLNVFAGIQNVLDRQYFEHLSFQRDPFRTGIKVPEIGRNFYINLSYLM